MRKEDLMMKFRKNQNKEKQIPKEKKPRVYYKVNPHKKVVIALWVLLGLSFSFAIFKHQIPALAVADPVPSERLASKWYGNGQYLFRSDADQPATVLS